MISNDVGAINHIDPIADRRKWMELCRQFAVKHLKNGDFEVEFFEPKAAPSPMALDPVSLAKALSESMPPDDAMLFAATEPVEEKITE